MGQPYGTVQVEPELTSRVAGPSAVGSSPIAPIYDRQKGAAPWVIPARQLPSATLDGPRQDSPGDSHKPGMRCSCDNASA